MKHGWFVIPNIQTGEREITERTTPLRALLPYVKGATILDLGCAEGMIGKWLMDHGAALLHGLDKHEPYLETAREIMPAGWGARFMQCDFDHVRKELPKLKLLASYDIVLCLNVAQKLLAPRRFLSIVSRMSSNIFVYSGPARVLRDARSGNIPLNVEKFLQPYFELIAEAPGLFDTEKGHLGVRMIFRRHEKVLEDRREKILAKRRRQRKILKGKRK